MIRQILGMTCQIIVIHILCPVIYFSHSLLHYIITLSKSMIFFGVHLFSNHRKIFLCSKARYTWHPWKLANFQEPPPSWPATSKILPPAWPRTGNFKRTPPVLSINSLILSAWLSIDFYLFRWSQPHPQSYLKK